jgi:hypothetical protein
MSAIKRVCLRIGLPAFAVLLAALALACGESGNGTGTPSAESPTPAVSPKVPEVPERTGIAELDAIIDGFVFSGTKPLWPLLRYTILPCTHAGGLGGPPGCRPDQEEGTAVEVMPVSTCELELLRPHEFERRLTGLVEQDIYGVYQATPEVRFPGDYVIVLTQPQADDPAKGMATDVIVKDGRIVGVDFSCVLTPEEAVELHELEEPLFLPDGTDQTPDTTY